MAVLNFKEECIRLEEDPRIQESTEVEASIHPRRRILTSIVLAGKADIMDHILNNIQCLLCNMDK